MGKLEVPEDHKRAGIRRMDDYLDQWVYLLRDVTTRGGATHRAGWRYKVSNHHRGKLDLLREGLTPPMVSRPGSAKKPNFIRSVERYLVHFCDGTFLAVLPLETTKGMSGDYFVGEAALESFLAILHKYEPFRMGGNVWQFKAFEVEGELLGEVSGHPMFAWRLEGEIAGPDDAEIWRLHHVGTGGLICSGPKDELLEKAQALLDDTPDFEAQVAKLGGAAGRERIPYAEACELLWGCREREFQKGIGAQRDNLRDAVSAVRHEDQ